MANDTMLGVKRMYSNEELEEAKKALTEIGIEFDGSTDVSIIAIFHILKHMEVKVNKDQLKQILQMILEVKEEV